MGTLRWKMWNGDPEIGPGLVGISASVFYGNY